MSTAEALMDSSAMWALLQLQSANNIIECTYTHYGRSTGMGKYGHVTHTAQAHRTHACLALQSLTNSGVFGTNLNARRGPDDAQVAGRSLRPIRAASIVLHLQLQSAPGLYDFLGLDL
eukprot:TRINITY_DN14786_c0_g1_i1.p3 TRINITY_DN14786_c0_g1~~TRINITY_DN14786_c0_g1_i1.p3  ORF type:complete len:118 (+),score=6.00 TRINITY_DN14786_c0_g1_i1:819-1172(+)